MSESPVPPPPPSRKPVPPPPPGKSPASMPTMAPLNASAPNVAMPAPTPAPVSAPAMSRPAGVPIMPSGGMPGMPGMPTPGMNPMVAAMEQRLQEMEKRFQDQDITKKSLENQITDLQKELKTEHEKLLVQSLKAKEDETLSVRVDQQLREIQERLRREKYEQELQESRGKAEGQLKEIERRLTQERETWMMALKNQLKEKESLERDSEQTFGRRLREFERRHEDEKNTWSQAMRQKDEEIHQLRRELQAEIDQWRHAIQDKEEQIEEAKEAGAQQRRSVELQAQAEARELQARLDNQIREAGTWKAQMALLQTQLQQMELQRQDDKARFEAQSKQVELQRHEERSRFDAQIQQIEKDHHAALRRQESLTETRIEDLQRDFNRRDAERTQHWEGMLGQLRQEKDALLRHMTQREEELARAQRDVAELRRLLDLEKANHQSEIEGIRRHAMAEAERKLPDLYADRIAQEKKAWEQQRQQEAAAQKALLARMADTEKALRAKLEVEEQRTQQDAESWAARLRDAEEQRQLTENARNEFEQELAQLRTTLQAERAQALQDMERVQEQWQTQADTFKNEIAQLNVQQLASEEKFRHSMTDAQKRQHELAKTIHDLQAQLTVKDSEIAQKSEAWDASYMQMNESMNALRDQLATLQKEREMQTAEGHAHEAAWKIEKASLEQQLDDLNGRLLDVEAQKTQVDARKTELERALTEAMDRLQAAEKANKNATADSAQSAKALSAIRQSMSDMQQLLSLARSGQKPSMKAA